MEQLKFHNETRKVNDLIEYEYNPRKLSEKQHRLLKESLEKFDLAEVPVIDIDNKIVAGHQRITILKGLGRGEEIIDVRVPNRKLTTEEFQQYNIQSNKIKGDWDFDILSSSFEIQDLKDWGFEDFELGLDVKPQNIENKEIDIDDLTTNTGSGKTKSITCPECNYEFEL